MINHPASLTTAHQSRLIAVGTELIHRRWPDAALNVFALPDDAILLTQPVRGGVSLYVAPDESVMFAASSLEPTAALGMFRAGERTDTAQFAAGLDGGGSE